MKKFLVLFTCLLAISCHKNPADGFIGNWTDGTWRHITITAAKGGGYVVKDISLGNRKFQAQLVGNELMVNIDKGNSTFDYLPQTDQLMAGAVWFHRVGTAKSSK
jgi:hypothetical protein